MKRDLIADLGVGAQVVEMAANGMRARDIVKKLTSDPDVRNDLVKRGDLMLYASDITLFLARDLKEKRALIGATLEEDRVMAIGIVQATKERLEGSLGVMGQWETIAQRSIAMLSDELDNFEETNALEPGSARFPVSQFDTTRKAVTEVLRGIRSLRDDQQVQALVRANTVHIKQGISQEELLDIVIALGRKLGHDDAVTSRAYTAVLMDRRKGKKSAAEDADFKVSPMAAAIGKAMFPEESKAQA